MIKRLLERLGNWWTNRSGLPAGWFQMAEHEQDTWALTRWLREELPDFTIHAVFDENGEFDIDVFEDDADLDAIRRSADEWFECAYGSTINWAEPQQITEEAFLQKRESAKEVLHD